MKVRERRVKSVVKPSGNADFLQHKIGWSIKEKEKLLEALKKYGSSDIDKLAKEVETKTASDVRFFITQKRTFINVGCVKSRRALAPLSRLEKWSILIHKSKPQKFRMMDRSEILTQAFQACTDQVFPEPTNAMDPNFSAIYQFLTDLLCDRVPPDLSPIDSYLVIRLLQILTAVVNKTDIQREKEFLGQVIAAQQQVLENNGDPEFLQNLNGEEAADPELGRRSLRDTVLFPSYKKRCDGIRMNWNPLNIPTNYLVDELAQFQGLTTGK